MAVTGTSAPTLVLLLSIILVRKWSIIVESNYVYNRVVTGSDNLTHSSKEKVLIDCEVLHRWARSGRPVKANVGVLFQTLLLLGGNIELNHGDRRNSCAICLEPVKCGDKSIQCSECNGLSHSRYYLNMNESQKVMIQSPYAWICPECNKSNYCWGHSTVEDIYRCKSQYGPLSSIESTQNIEENISTITKTKKSKNLNNV